MKFLIAILALVTIMILLSCGGCSVNTSSNIDFNANSIGYARDDRTGLCFAFVASRKTMSMSTSGLGLTHVPCTDDVLEAIRLMNLRKYGR